ncbi:related to NAD-dependent protein deacetylase HST2 [Saccharomycodes ludwigii]|uniref:NAD-dependent protein deacetylase n=1 Tax=Saccharomycodes ludwigii TaxID=36035 RepID=A0A376B185_9ASCO|nr:hypothetical protein SCDLUD_000703 [Saccharomycodes ludwigii]KAH3903092.1 hypothetical protein SCDLUD_000703 [Saccharomycodes ludwigii]SSD58427.1 related to NAD-dependent protein deacetylase HST2 [Saccharomycodes ludwigii]
MKKSIKQLSSILKENPNSKVIFMVGAGISTSCGIPDFRSPKTGLYHNLSKLNLPYAEAVFDIDFFKNNPVPFYILAKELYPGNFKPSKFHYFMKLMEDKNRLHRVYTQNIDTLEREAGISGEKIIEAHGSFASNHCINCNERYELEIFKEKVTNFEEGPGKHDFAKCRKCVDGLIKPNIVFFGENLPSSFFTSLDYDRKLLEKNSDDYIVIFAGTSLAVYPFCSSAAAVPEMATRSLVNKELVGNFKKEPRDSDIVILENCDSVVEELARELGWLEDLEKLISGSDDVKADALEELAADIEKNLTLDEVNITPLTQRDSAKHNNIELQSDTVNR